MNDFRLYTGVDRTPFFFHFGVAHDENPPGRGSGRYPKGSGKRPDQPSPIERKVTTAVRSIDARGFTVTGIHSALRKHKGQEWLQNMGIDSSKLKNTNSIKYKEEKKMGVTVASKERARQEMLANRPHQRKKKVAEGTAEVKINGGAYNLPAYYFDGANLDYDEETMVPYGNYYGYDHPATFMSYYREEGEKLDEALNKPLAKFVIKMAKVADTVLDLVNHPEKIVKLASNAIDKIRIALRHSDEYSLYMGLDSSPYLIHYGKGHDQGGHSGRYPWGSGERPKQSLEGLTPKEKIKALRDTRKSSIKRMREVENELANATTSSSIRRLKSNLAKRRTEVSKATEDLRAAKNDYKQSKQAKRDEMNAAEMEERRLRFEKKAEEKEAKKQEKNKAKDETRLAKAVEKDKGSLLKPDFKRMTDEELNKRIKRMRDEESYLKLIGKKTPSEEKQERYNMMSSLVKESLKSLVSNVLVPTATGYMINSIKKSQMEKENAEIDKINEGIRASKQSAIDKLNASREEAKAAKQEAINQINTRNEETKAAKNMLIEQLKAMSQDDFDAWKKEKDHQNNIISAVNNIFKDAEAQSQRDLDAINKAFKETEAQQQRDLDAIDKMFKEKESRKEASLYDDIELWTKRKMK